jgi:hypothetical protein
MNYSMQSTFLFVSLVLGSAFAKGQVSTPNRTHETNLSEASGILRTPGSSWERWLDHGARESTATSQGPPANLGAPAPAASSSSTGVGAEFIGPIPSSHPSRSKFGKEKGLVGTGTGSGGR